jgi:trk system potassium uptake protein TrkH
MATGGFSSRAASVGGFNSPLIEAIIIVFMIAAGVNFGLHYRALFMGDRRAFVKDHEFRWYLGFIGVATAIVVLSIAGKMGFAGAVRHGLFQVTSIMTTPGFVTVDFDAWPEVARLVLLLLMFVGACAGSTGGAIKVARLIILGKHLYRELLQTIHPTAVLPITQGREVMPEKTVRQITAFIGLYLASFIFATLYMSYLGLDLTSAASSVAATLGNIGPGLGSVGPTCDYAHIAPSGKALLTLMMLLGRLEIVTVMAVLTPAFWRR